MTAALKALRLRLVLAVRAAGAVRLLGAALALGGALALAWSLAALNGQESKRVAALRAASTITASAPASRLASNGAPPAAAKADANLVAFHDVLGERRYVEQQVGTLFALAKKHGLTLAQGDYKSAVDRRGGFATYQVNLPVKGSYGAIWDFAIAALGAMPYAALDDISFRRDSVGQAGVEARVRLTLYLQERP
jgi:hypothetical protein